MAWPPGAPEPGTAGAPEGRSAGGAPGGRWAASASGTAARAATTHVFVADLETLTLADDDLHHLTRVLRLRAGEAVSVADGRGGWCLCRHAGGGTLEPAGEPERHSRPEPPITVALAPPKGDRADWAVQKLTEVGVDAIIPLVAERSVVRWPPERVGRQLDRWRAIARHAAMQSRRLWVPDVAAPRAPAELLGGAGGVAVADPAGVGPRLDWPTVLVGPEGGWGPEEVPAGVPLVAVGGGVLRTETAAVVCGALLTALRDGLTAGVG